MFFDEFSRSTKQVKDRPKTTHFKDKKLEFYFNKYKILQIKNI